jgi:hypothetical protein
MRGSSITSLGILCGLALLACGRSDLDVTRGVGMPSGSGGGPGRGTQGGAGTGFGAAGGAGSSGSSKPIGDPAGTAANDGGAADRISTNQPAGPGQPLYTMCSTLGAFDCSRADPRIRLLCDGMTWNPIAKCSSQQVCDVRAGSTHGLCIDSEGPPVANAPNEDLSGTGVILYTRCSTLGALSCSAADAKIQVLCDGQTWNPIEKCAGQLVCDAKPGPNQGLCKAP